MTDDDYVFADVAGTSGSRTFSLGLTRFADASGAGEYLVGFPDRLRDSGVEDIAFAAGAPTLGDESNAATGTFIDGNGRVRHYVDLVVRVDREIFRLRVSGAELLDCSVAETLATEQVACLQGGGCLAALDPPAELLA